MDAIPRPVRLNFTANCVPSLRLDFARSSGRRSAAAVAVAAGRAAAAAARFGPARRRREIATAVRNGRTYSGRRRVARPALLISTTNDLWIIHSVGRSALVVGQEGTAQCVYRICRL